MLTAQLRNLGLIPINTFLLEALRCFEEMISAQKFKKVMQE